jgi:hypothetical protein
MNLDKHFLSSKINVTAILVGIISIASIADKLPPQFAHLAPWLTLAGMVATVLFRTFFTTNTDAGSPDKLVVLGKPPATPTLAIAAAIAAIIFTRCAIAPASLPYRACLFERSQARGLFLTGEVVAQDADQRVRFRYDDPTWGDHDDKRDPRHGFIWIADNDEQRVVRRCQAASPFGDLDASRQAAAVPHDAWERQ